MESRELMSFSKIHLELPMSGGWPFIKDPIHGEINFQEYSFWLYELLNTPEFQRLSSIDQLGFLHENFPGATHTRLSHSLGVYALSSKFISHFLSLGDLTVEKDQLEIDLCLAASLLHDLGHGPFSHFFEWLSPGFSHEKMTKRLILNKNSKLYFLLSERSAVYNREKEFFPEEITKILARESNRKWIEELISSDIDVDRLDYLLRDKYFCGSFTLSIDPSLIIKWTRLLFFKGQRRLIFLEKTNYQRYSLLLSREYMQKEIYSNLSSCAYQIMIFSIFQEWKKIFKEKFSNNNFYKLLEPIFSQEFQEWEIESFLRLTDISVLSRIEELFWELKKDSSGAEKLYSLLLLFRGHTLESQHVLLRFSLLDYEKFRKFTEEKCSQEEIEQELIQVKSSSSLLGAITKAKIPTLSYLDWASKEIKELKLDLPSTKNREIHFVLITKRLKSKWLLEWNKN